MMPLTLQLAESNARILAGLRAGAYDFADFGTNQGGGFSIGERLGGQRGVGFELDPALAQWNLDRGRDVMCLDIRALPPGITGIRFAVCSHVLEHLPSLYDVGSVIAALAPICRDFLLISGPNFDSEAFLYGHNLKVVHSAMRDHLCRFHTIDLIRVLFDLGLRDFTLGLSEQMRDSGNIWIHRADAPAEGLWTWQEGSSLPKPFVPFDPPLHRDIVCVVRLHAAVDTDAVLHNFLWGCNKVIVRSAQRFPIAAGGAPPAITAAPSPARLYRRASLADIADDPQCQQDGRPTAERVALLPPAVLEVPALGFGDTDMGRQGIVLHPPGDPGALRLEHGGCMAFLLRNAVVHGKYGVVTLGGQVLADTLHHFPVHNVPGAAWEGDDALLLPELKPAATVHAASHLLTCNLDNYYHWLIEAASRFSRATYELFSRHPETETTPFLLSPPLDTAWKSEILALLVPAEAPRLSPDAAGRVLVQRLLYVPDLSGAGWNPHPALLETFDTIRAGVLGGTPAPRPWRRLYISRADSANRVLANEAEVIARAGRAGFTPILLSRLSVAEQVRLFAEASHILAPHGAGLTNIGFCQRGTVLCELHMDSYVHWTFRRLAALRGVRYGCLVGTTTGERQDWVHGNTWRLDLAALERVLADPRFMGDAPAV